MKRNWKLLENGPKIGISASFMMEESHNTFVYTPLKSDESKVKTRFWYFGMFMEPTEN